MRADTIYDEDAKLGRRCTSQALPNTNPLQTGIGREEKGLKLAIKLRCWLSRILPGSPTLQGQAVRNSGEVPPVEPWRGSALHGRPGVLWGPRSGRRLRPLVQTLTRLEVSRRPPSRPLAANQGTLCAPLGSALAPLRQTQLCPTATWVFPSPGGWQPALEACAPRLLLAASEVRLASLGAGEEHRETQRAE